MIASENLFPLKQYLSIATNTCPCTKRFSLKYVFPQSSFPEEMLPIKKVFPYFFPSNRYFLFVLAPNSGLSGLFLLKNRLNVYVDRAVALRQRFSNASMSGLLVLQFRTRRWMEMQLDIWHDNVEMKIPKRAHEKWVSTLKLLTCKFGTWLFDKVCFSWENLEGSCSYSFWTSSRCALSFILRSPSSQVQVCRDFFWTTAFAWYPNGIWSWQVSKDGLWGMPRNIQKIQEINMPQWLIDVDLQMPRSGSQSQNRRGTMKQALQEDAWGVLLFFNHIFRAYQCHPSRNWWLYHIDSDHIDTSTQFGTFLLNIPIMMHLWFIGEALLFTWLCPGRWQSQACSKESRLELVFFDVSAFNRSKSIDPGLLFFSKF